MTQYAAPEASLIEEEIAKSWTLQLYKEWHELLRYYRLNLATPLIQLSQSRSRYGSYDPLQQTLSISVHLIREHSWDVVLEILKHEAAHALVAQGRAEENAHGPAFHQACERLGVAPWARQAQIELDPFAAVQQHRLLSQEQERLLRRVEKLLSLASSPNTHEASLAMERARELAARHQLEAFMQGQKPAYTYVLIQHGKKVMPAHQTAISSILCTHFYVDCVSRSLYDAPRRCSLKVLEILGSQENVQMAEYVYWFLWNQLPLLWQTYQAEKNKAYSRSSQRSFYLGVLNGFHEKLAQQKRAMEADRAPINSAAGLLISRQESAALEKRLSLELRQFVSERYPQLHRGGSRRQGLIYADYETGHQRGRELNLHRGLTQTQQGDIQLLPSGKG